MLICPDKAVRRIFISVQTSEKKKKKEEIIPHLWFFFGLIFYPNEWGAIQRDLNRVKQWAHVNFMIFNKSKGKVSYQGYGNLC